MTVSEAMKKAREKAGLTQAQLSKISGVFSQNISKYELGQALPRVDTVELLADALGISIDEYVGHEVKAGVKNATH